MAKTQGEVGPPKPITAAEREARKAFRHVDAEKAMTEHEIAHKAFSSNRERLKAERLAREAAGTVVAETELASRSASRRAPPASVPGASTANSVALRRPITSDSRAADLIACTYRPRPVPPWSMCITRLRKASARLWSESTSSAIPAPRIK